MSDRAGNRIVLDESTDVKAIQVAGSTNPKQLAGAICAEFRKGMEHKTADGSSDAYYPNVSLHAIGHQAVGQAIKSVPIANGDLVPRGVMLTILPSFEDKMVSSETDPGTKVQRTVIRMRLIPWKIGG